MPESSSAEMFDLFASRVIRLQEGDRVFTITCKRPSADDWRDYFRSISITSKQNGAERINLLDIETPRLRLAERIILKAEGYTVADGKKLSDLPNWVSRLPSPTAGPSGSPSPTFVPTQGPATSPSSRRAKKSSSMPSGPRSPRMERSGSPSSTPA